MAAMAKSGAATATSMMVKRVLSGWGGSYLAGRKALRYLNDSDGFINYLTRHVSIVNKVRTIHSNEADVFLDDIYYPLTVCDMNAEFDYISDLSAVKNEIKIDDNFISFEDKLTNIIGIAGQGKSTILRKAFMQSIFNGDKIPLFIELRNAEKNGVAGTIIKVLRSIGVDANETVLTDIMKANKIMLFLDGFDEISSESRAGILDEIIDMNLRYEVKIVTSSRPETEICHTSNIKNLKVRKLKKEDVIGIIKKLKSSKAEETNNDTDNIIKKIESEDNLSQVMISPILVTLLYVCYPYMDITPNNHVEFYTNLFNTLYLRHDKLKGYTREKRSKLGNTQAYDSFCAFSFVCLQKNYIGMSHHEMIESARISLRNTVLDEPDKHPPEDLCDDFIHITCLIQKDGYQRYSFLHKSICEFHAASFIKNIGIDSKPRFYDSILEKIYHNNTEMLNTVIFLKNIDYHDFSKNLTIPLLEKVGVNRWENPRDSDIDDFIADTLHGAVARVKNIQGNIFFSSMKLTVRNTWISLYESDMPLGSRTDIHRLIFNHLWRKSFVEDDLINDSDEKSVVNAISLLDDDLRLAIRKEIKEIMISLYNNIYKKTKDAMDSSQENMLSLLKLS